MSQRKTSDPKQSKTAHYHPTIALIENIVAEVATDADFSHRFMFGGVGFYSRGRIFGGMINPDQLMLKLPAHRREALIEAGANEPGYTPDSPMGPQYVLVPKVILNDSHKLIDWVNISLNHVWNLPAPKPKK